MARSRWFHAQISKYITGTDRRTVLAQTVLSLTQPFNARYALEYPFSAQFLTQRGAQTSVIY
jgi:hypothetical protein